MAYLQVTNRAKSTLATAIVAADTSLSVAAGEGALFPASNFAITIENERILVGTRTTDSFASLTRGYDGTTAAAHAAATAVELRIIAPHITELQTGKFDNNVSVADKILGRVTAGAGVVEEIACTAAGRALLDDVDVAAQRVTLGNVPTLAGAETLTNKRITLRVGTIASSATPTPDGDANDIFTVTALAEAATFAAPTGTPTNGQKLIIRIKDNATARALGWNAIYRAVGTALPSTTVLSKTLYCGFIYNSTDSKFDLVASAQEG